MVLELDTLRGRIYDVYEVAKLLGINADSVRLRIRKGDLPARKVPGDRAYCILGDDLIVYLSGTPYRPPEAKKRAGRGNNTKGATVRPVKKPLGGPDGAGTGGAIPTRLPDGSVDRPNAWIAETGVAVTTISEKAGIERSSLAHIIGGDRGLSRVNAIRLRDAYGQELLDFLMGDAPMPGDP